MSSDSSGLRSGSPVELDLLRAQPTRERTDAAANRQRILAAATDLVAAHGIDALSMDAVAAAAGVGKGTVFRRFGDKSGLISALLDAQEYQLQEKILFGEPPLGPGAPAAQRLEAFFGAYLDYVLANLDLVATSETASPGARYRIGAYRFWQRHVTILLGEDRALAHALLATVAAEDLRAAVTAGTRDTARDAVMTVVKAVARAALPTSDVNSESDESCS